jgi:flavin reductase (DIM6/NTAB) family NADH-FMN oxidoreductase RutF
MFIDLHALTPTEVYFTLSQLLIPRPIAWVLSVGAAGNLNVAPFSYFSGVCSDPPLIMLSIGRKKSGDPKDTRTNIQQRRDFVVHITHDALLQPVEESAVSYPAEVSEVDVLGLELAPFPGSRLPRLADCRVAMGCVCHEIFYVGNVDQALILGRVNALFIHDDLIERDAQRRLKIPAGKLNPLARLGAGEYALLGPDLLTPEPGTLKTIVHNKNTFFNKKSPAD